MLRDPGASGAATTPRGGMSKVGRAGGGGPARSARWGVGVGGHDVSVHEAEEPSVAVLPDPADSRPAGSNQATVGADGTPDGPVCLGSGKGRDDAPPRHVSPPGSRRSGRDGRERWGGTTHCPNAGPLTALFQGRTAREGAQV